MTGVCTLAMHCIALLVYEPAITLLHDHLLLLRTHIRCHGPLVSTAAQAQTLHACMQDRIDVYLTVLHIQIAGGTDSIEELCMNSVYLIGSKALPEPLVGLPCPEVQGAEATDGLCDSSGRIPDPEGNAFCMGAALPLGSCPLCLWSAAFEVRSATAGKGQQPSCCLSSSAFWEGEVAEENWLKCPLAVALGAGRGRGGVAEVGLGGFRKEGWRVTGAETQFG